MYDNDEMLLYILDDDLFEVEECGNSFKTTQQDVPLETAPLEQSQPPLA